MSFEDNGFKIRKVLDLEKIRAKEEEEVKSFDSLSNEQVLDRATTILNSLDLTFTDLADKKVVDLGSGSQFLERAAAIKGLDTVWSVEKRENILSKKSELKHSIAADITKGIPQILDNSIDLLISHAGPPTGARTKEDIDACFAEILRMLKKNGEARISAPVFNFVERQHKRLWDFFERNGQDKNGLTVDEKKEMNEIMIIVQEESVKYLQEKGINIVIKKSDLDGYPYGIIKK